MNYLCIVSGKVQGVFYRASVQAMASDAGYSGYVRNLPDGNVEAGVSIDEQHTLEHFLAILKAGSPYSRVNHIETRQTEGGFSDGFIILR